MSAYPLYGRSQIKQRGGYEPFYVQRKRAHERAARKAYPLISGLLTGIYGAVEGYKRA